MKPVSLVIIIQLIVSLSFGQSYAPVPVKGFNADVIAEGAGRSSLATTSREMDAYDPSNFVLCSKQFAMANGMPPGYGIPDNGLIAMRDRAFALASYGPRLHSNNALYLLYNQTGTLWLTTPKHFSTISILGLSTEGPATLTVVLTFADSSKLTWRNQKYPDWFDGPNPAYYGFGRVKRADGGAGNPLYHEGAPNNPRMYLIENVLPQEKALVTIQFHNVSPGSNPQSNRAFIFAVAGVEAIPPVKEKVVVKEKVAPPEEKIIPPKEVVKEKVAPPEEKIIPVKEVVVVAAATAITIEGEVRDAKTGKPLEAVLKFTGSKTLSVSSGKDGKYHAEFPDVAEYQVKIEAPGYIGILEKINLQAATHSGINYVLSPIEVGTHVNLKNVLFELGSAKLQESSFPELDMVVDFMNTNPAVNIELAGHTDNRGSKSMNLKLSNDRVIEVKKYLVSRGIPAQRVTGKGYGGSKPIAPGSSEDARRLNRRVEFIITGN